MPKRKVFISHSWEDNEISRKLAECLKRDGVDIWIDYTRIHGGDSLPQRISEALEWCDTLILLWSKSAKDSYYVNLEWQNALDLQKVIIPCLLDETKRPAILRRCRFIDFNDFEEGYRQLAYALDLAIKKDNLPPTPFRSNPITLSDDQFKTILRKHNFFDSNWNKKGQGFSHQFELKDFHGEKVVLDKACGLMWQQSGSSRTMAYEEARHWIQTQLNKKKYAGYNNWRLPTLEEAMSLVEPKQNNNKLYIDPMFDSKQTWIWTSDQYQGVEGQPWVVYFNGGRSSGRNIHDGGLYVRAVRFGQSS